MKKIILLTIIFTAFVFGQFEDIGSSEYNFSYKDGKKIGSIIKSLEYQKQLSNSSWIESSSYKKNAPVYQFDRELKQGKVLKEKDYHVKKDEYDHIDGSLWYEYHLNVYSKYPNGQIKEEGSFEKRYGGDKKLGFRPVLGAIKASMDILLLPMDIVDGDGLGHDLDEKDYLFKDGQWTEWFEDGSLKFKVNYKGGLRDGQWDEYYKNGQKKYGGVFKGNTKKGKHAEWYASGWIKEYSVDGVVKRSHKESEQAFFWNAKNDKNYQAAYALAKASYSEISNPSKELELESKSNPVSSERIYETFAFTGEYESYANSWYVGQFITGWGSATVAISINSRYSASVFLDSSIGWMNGSLSYDGSYNLGDKYVWRHKNATNNQDDIIFYFNDSERAIYTGGEYRMSRQTSRSINAYEVEYIFNCKDGKCTKD